MNRPVEFAQPQSAVLETNKVLKNTYALLSVTLLFSALTAFISMQINIGGFMPLVATFGALGLIWFVLPRTANSAAGIAVVFGITGLLGLGLGPMLNNYLQMANGSQLIMTALGGTGVIFLALSGYALTTRKDFSFMGGMLVVGMVLVLITALANIFMEIPALSLALSAAIILIMSGFILYDTSRIINGGEKNYIMATVGLYLSLYNIFVNLLMLLGVMSDD
ncbi:Bax inhibitor-1/YccA family protein [sulfur-oxidizing endosymbiont of Gigantopelta aegis]|uniref:Bax inhibitor-1/YccA family protein n=1 Tax=sulfur-oxidizing endosymbiont of Gigantopelta aegis TaxID=2794934 RepID=UPI0018DC434E|nr:Bax inhibitor-1/YccA family protein [sulfur-oxidizing endosymbiont of Gigantopelta aegis]